MNHDALYTSLAHAQRTSLSKLLLDLKWRDESRPMSYGMSDCGRYS